MTFLWNFSRGSQTLFYYLYRRFETYSLRLKFRLTDAGRFIAASIIISAAIGVDTKQTMAFVVFTFLSSIFIISIFYAVLFKINLNSGRSLNLKVSRVIAPYAAVNTEFMYKIVITSLSKRHEIGLELIDMPSHPRPSLNEFLTLREPNETKRNLYDRTLAYYRWAWLIDRKNHGIKPSVISIPQLTPNNTIEILIKITPKTRGLFSFKEIIICMGDPFGLLRAFYNISLEQSLIILPRYYPIPQIYLPNIRKYNQGGAASALFIGDSMDFYAIRDYVYGDPLRHIDWKGWAKTDRPVIKLYQQEWFIRQGIVLDTFGGLADDDDVFEGAVELAASLLMSVKTQESLIDLIFFEDKIYSVTVGRGLAHKINAMELLAGVRLCNGSQLHLKEIPFDQLSQYLKRRLRLFSSLICIFIKWDKERSDLVDIIRASHIPIKVLLINDPLKNEVITNIEGVTIIDLKDINSGLKIDI